MYSIFEYYCYFSNDDNYFCRFLARQWSNTDENFKHQGGSTEIMMPHPSVGGICKAALNIIAI
jgi:hypothetical protein